MSDSSDRWTMLSGNYAAMQDRFSDEHPIASMLARSLRIQLKDYLGGGPKSVSIYDYDEDKQTYTPADHEFEATAMNQDYKWFLAYGVTLERQPNAYPKTTFQFPVWFTWMTPSLRLTLHSAL